VEKLLEKLGTTESTTLALKREDGGKTKRPGRPHRRGVTVQSRILTGAERMALSRFRRKRGIHRRTVSLSEDKLDKLEERGYLDPGFRGAGDDESEALQAFIEWAAFLREAERQGLIESFMGDDGQVLYEVTGKQPKPGDGGTGELDS
jgi:hypothetical protein